MVGETFVDGRGRRHKIAGGTLIDERGQTFSVQEVILENSASAGSQPDLSWMGPTPYPVFSKEFEQELEKAKAAAARAALLPLAMSGAANECWPGPKRK
jgi:hypothetical protein